MAVTFAFQGTKPSPGAEILAAPITDSLDHIINTLNAANLSSGNVNTTGTDLIVVADVAQTITKLKSWETTDAAAGGVREVAQFGIDPVSGTPAANDGGRLVFYADDAGGTESDIAYLDYVMTTATAGSEVGRLDFYVAASGAPVSQLQITDGSINPTTTDDISLGTSALNFSDLFLDLGAVVNFNSGDVTITHSANVLALDGGVLSVDTTTESTSTTTGSIHTDGGLGVVGDIYAGDDIFFASGGVLNFNAGNVTVTHSSGALTNSGTLTNTGLVTATAGITSGSDIKSDTDSTDDLGTTGVRWANVYTDSIGDSGQQLLIPASSIRAESNPAFLAHPSGVLSNVTGDGTSYTVVFATEVFDQGADYATSTFTAPVTGRYQINVSLGIAGLTSSTTVVSLNIVASNRTFNVGYANPYACSGGGTDFTIPGSVIADMDAADTVHISISVHNGAKVVDLTAASFFSACLLT